MSETFDATKHLRQLRGKGGTADYLDVKWRLVWLRTEHPDAITEIEHVEITPDIAIFKAQVMIPGKGRATDYGSETPRDFGDYIEKAATKALGRALAQLGFGTQFVGFELDENTRIVDSPVNRKGRESADEHDEDAAEPAYDGRWGNSAAQPATPRQQPRSAPVAPVADKPAPFPGTDPYDPRASQKIPDGPMPTMAELREKNRPTPAPPAASNPHPLLAEIRDQTRTMQDRERALTDYYMGAHTTAELNTRQEAVKGCGLGSRAVAETYNFHAKRIERPAPAPTVPHPGVNG